MLLRAGGECSVTVLRSWAGCGDATGLSVITQGTLKWDSICQASCREAAQPVPPASVTRWDWDLCDSVLCACPRPPREPVTAGSGSSVSPPEPPAALLVQQSGARWHRAAVVAGVYVLLWAITNKPQLFSVPKTGPKPAQFRLGNFPVYPLGKLWFILVSGPPQSVCFCTLGVPDGLLWNCSFSVYFGIAPFCGFMSSLSFVCSFVLGECKVH